MLWPPFFQVEISSSFNELEHIDVAKKIIIRARMCSSGCGSVDELGNIKTTILSTRLDGTCILALIYYTKLTACMFRSSPHLL